MAVGEEDIDGFLFPRLHPFIAQKPDARTGIEDEAVLPFADFHTGSIPTEFFCFKSGGSDRAANPPKTNDHVSPIV